SLLLYRGRGSLDQSRVAGGSPLLPCPANPGAGRCKRHYLCGDRIYFFGSVVSLLSGKRTLQGFHRSLLLLHISGQGFLRTSYHPVRLPLSGNSADCSPAFSSQRTCAFVAGSTAFLFVDQHSRLLVARPDPVFSHCCRRAGEKRMGTGGR